jgi:hypothetical protein
VPAKYKLDALSQVLFCRSIPRDDQDSVAREIDKTPIRHGSDGIETAIYNNGNCHPFAAFRIPPGAPMITE